MWKQTFILHTLIFKLLLIHGNHKNDNSLDAYYSTIFQMLYTYTSLFIHKMYSIIHCVLFSTTMIKLRIHFNFNINFIFYYYTTWIIWGCPSIAPISGRPDWEFILEKKMCVIVQIHIRNFLPSEIAYRWFKNQWLSNKSTPVNSFFFLIHVGGKLMGRGSNIMHAFYSLGDDCLDIFKQFGVARIHGFI